MFQHNLGASYWSGDIGRSTPGSPGQWGQDKDDIARAKLPVSYMGFCRQISRAAIRCSMILGIPGFPKFGELKHYDVYFSVKNKMSLHSNRLAVATQTLGIEGKTPLPPEIWGPARLGYSWAMEKIEEHNREDVKILEGLYHEILPYVQVTRKSI